jgi:hypothetical protein
MGIVEIASEKRVEMFTLTLHDFWRKKDIAEGSLMNDEQIRQII